MIYSHIFLQIHLLDWWDCLIFGEYDSTIADSPKGLTSDLTFEKLVLLQYLYICFYLLFY